MLLKFFCDTMSSRFLLQQNSTKRICTCFAVVRSSSVILTEIFLDATQSSVSTMEKNFHQSSEIYVYHKNLIVTLI